MKFKTPDTTVEFEIPDEWWSFSEMSNFTPSGGGYYPYKTRCVTNKIAVVPLRDIEPSRRGANVPPFKKYKLIPILFALSSPECALPPVEVHSFGEESTYAFKVYDGYQRFYASVAAGFRRLPIIVRQPLY
jgi:hypothetical protein